jgi:hypothetical protein
LEKHRECWRYIPCNAPSFNNFNPIEENRSKGIKNSLSFTELKEEKKCS